MKNSAHITAERDRIKMEKCTICGTESKENICPVCGNERTADAVRYGTFAPLPKAAADIRNVCIAKYKTRLGVESKAQPEQRAANSVPNKNELQSQISEHKPTNLQEEAAKLKHFDEVIKQEPSQEAPPRQKAKMSRLLTMFKLAIMILGAPSFVVIFASYFVPLPFTVEKIAVVFGIASLVIFIKENK